MDKVFPHTTLHRFARAVLEQMGTPPAEAILVADHLVDANLMGHDSHGVGMLPTYTWSLKTEWLRPTAHARVIADRDTVIVIDGERGFGQVVGPEAMRLGIARAKERHVCVVALKNAHHLGRIGAYAEMAAAEGLVSMHYVNVVGHPPQVAPFGSAESRLNTNPFTCGIPIRGGEPVVLDMATSMIALGKVREAVSKGAKVPMGSVVDHLGRPTDDPTKLVPGPDQPAGALTAFGLHKGSGLALLCELLGGALAGDWPITKAQDGPPTVFNGMLTVIFDPESIAARDVFDAHFRAVVDHIHGSRTAEGVERALVPGEPERITRAERLRDGIPISDGAWAGLIDLAQKLGMSDDAIAATTAA